MRASHVRPRGTGWKAVDERGRPVTVPSGWFVTFRPEARFRASSRRPRMLRTRESRFVPIALTAAFAALLFGACGSPSAKDAPHEKTGRPQRVKLVDYVSHANLELVNESHSDRSQTYSNTVALANATRKVTTDEVLDEVIDQYRTNGFFEHAAPGSAPTDAPANVGKAIEVEDGGKTVTWMVLKTAPKEDRELFSRCTALFGTVYNNTYQLQSVDHAPDWQTPVSPKNKKGS
jgi:hypothetical protein